MKFRKIFKKNKKIIRKTTRWSLVFMLSFVICLKIIENTSNNLYDLILTTPEITKFTNIQDNPFTFFM
ncbi:MAG: hypothetical protein PHH98_02010 [Candidatus Gracilibacteria bacterium]|nr:hypothetical protein [Candidatus Gracilibacteria bacterium]